ncbi:uncharacterized protein LOC143277573 [Babylonia areolata]|uniref:uncharacterized protein LOC143277573 n=1 Tax=Babylonia areolata TaxID=304850 RepID=UPI003FD4FCB2
MHNIQTPQSNIAAELKSLTLEALSTKYPPDTWARAYTDGSAEEAVKNGGSGVYVRFPDVKTISKSVATGNLSTNFRAEACALLLAAQTFSQEDTLPTNTVFLTDCKSILQSLQAPGGEEILTDIRQELNLLKQITAVVLQWIPPHCGIGGNEEADRLYKTGSKLEQPAHPSLLNTTTEEIPAAVRGLLWCVASSRHSSVSSL